MSSFEIVDLLEHASRQPDFPQPVRLHEMAVSECCVNDQASKAFHLLANKRGLDLKASFEPVLTKVMSDKERNAWFVRKSVLVVDIALTKDLSYGVSHETIWFLLNHADFIGAESQQGFVVPSVRRVNGSPLVLEPLCLEVGPVTYEANLALEYGESIVEAGQREKAELLAEYFSKYPML